MVVVFVFVYMGFIICTGLFLYSLFFFCGCFVFVSFYALCVTVVTAYVLVVPCYKLAFRYVLVCGCRVSWWCRLCFGVGSQPGPSFMSMSLVVCKLSLLLNRVIPCVLSVHFCVYL